MYDLVCIGFGPAQLATAIANREARKPHNALFVERKPAFSWHDSHHLARTRMENPFLYDLATTRNPRSAFSYVHFLLKKDRLVEFANSDRLNPLRMEFEEYLQWCAAQFKDEVRYSNEAVKVTAEKENGVVRQWKVDIKDESGKTYTVQARSIVAPSLPEKRDGKVPPQALTSVNFLAGQRIVPIDDYLSKRNEIRGRREVPLNVAIVGSGQQAVEILDDLLSCPRLGSITVVSENEALAPLKVLSDGPEPPHPRLCSIWERPASEQKTSVPESSELIQSIYNRAYEKLVVTKGKYGLRVVMGRETAEPCAAADVIIAERTQPKQLTSSALFHEIDALVLGCRQKGDSLEEVQFKRGAVAGGCRLWMVWSRSAGGRSLAKDIAVRAGEVVSALAVTDATTAPAGMAISARI
ncbi:hypothetical protein P280DRAFT_194775 [Massarina eburnea CBS 473.64]|uniref:L-ornithine N(5)-monooxygenase [NAD(P)H] n=1 Tax=Massarina eburnea CBS 473.64 TaxID=1395130 RepID=A0A6A6RLP4_9PLEO|nr:hypothetical protein P280DRAFT_194775 [Massarina eburnea CBS 473.64]